MKTLEVNMDTINVFTIKMDNDDVLEVSFDNGKLHVYINGKLVNMGNIYLGNVYDLKVY